MLWFLILCVPAIAVAQPDEMWDRLYGTNQQERANSLIQTADGGFFMVGNAMYSAGEFKPYCVLANAEGDQLWARFIENGNEGEAYAAVEDFNGDLIIAGSHGDFGTGYAIGYVERLSPGGVTLDVNLYPLGDVGYFLDIDRTNDGGFILVGRYGPWDGNADGVVVRITASGDMLWTRQIGPSGQDDIFNCVQTLDDGFLVGGWSEPGTRDFWLVRLDEDGNVLWQDTYGSGVYDFPSNIGVLTDGNYFISGESIYGEFSHAASWTLHISSAPESAGEIIREIEIDDGHVFRCGDAVAMPDNGIAVVGELGDESYNNINFVVYRLDSLGGVVWSRLFGFDFNHPCGIVMCADSGLAILSSPNIREVNWSDFWLIRLESEYWTEAATPHVPLADDVDIAVYPNPFNSTTTLRFNMTKPGMVRLDVFDLNGRMVHSQVHQAQAGSSIFQINSNTWASGSYFAELTLPQGRKSVRLTLLK